MTLFTRRNALKLGLAGGALALATPSQALVEIIVTGGDFTPLPIAIPDFASSDPAFGAEIAQLVDRSIRPRCRSGSATCRTSRTSPPGVPRRWTRW